MKGLLYKEVFLARQWLIFLACIEVLGAAALIFCAATVAKEQPETIFVLHGLIAFVMFFLTAVIDDVYFAHDEKRAWSIFVSATPGTMKEQILCKYYVIFLENLCILFIGYIMDIVTIGITGDVTNSAGQIYFLFFCIYLFVKAFIQGFNVRFGSAVGKTVLGIFAMLLGSLFGLWFLFGDISFIMDNSGETLKDFLTRYLSERTGMWVLALLPYIAVAAYYISYRISIKSYRKGVENYDE